MHDYVAIDWNLTCKKEWEGLLYENGAGEIVILN